VNSEYIRLTMLLAIHHSPFTIHNSQFTIHNSQFTIHHSPFTIHHLTSSFPSYTHPVLLLSSADFSAYRAIAKNLFLSHLSIVGRSVPACICLRVDAGGRMHLVTVQTLNSIRDLQDTVQE